MLDDFLFCINAVLPMFLVICVGYLFRRIDLIDVATMRKFNVVVFNCALPAMLFRDISHSVFSRFFDPVLLLYAIIVTVVSFGLTWGFAELCMKDKTSIGVFVQGSIRSNYAILGLILISSVMGDKAQGKGALVTSFVVPLYNILSIMVLSIRSRNSVAGGALIRKSIKSICRNPLIIGILLALPVSFFQIKIPVVLDTAVNYLGSLATPLALLAIGGCLDFKEVRARLKWASIAAAIKLIVIPIVFLPIAVVFLHMRGEELLVIAIMCGSPTAVSSYIMASQMGGDEYLAANIVLLSTLFSALTYTIGLFIFRVTGLI